MKKKKMTMEKLVELVEEYTEDNVELNQLTRFLETLKERVIYARGEKEDDILVLTRGGLIEKFDKDAIYRSLINSADATGGFMTDSDIKQVTEDVIHEIKENRPYNVISSRDIMLIVEQQLNKHGFNKVADTYCYY